MRGIAGFCTAEGGGRARSREQLVKAEGQAQLQLTRADVQRMLDVDRVYSAAAALDATQKEAAQAASECKWMSKYLQTVRACLPNSGDDADGEAELLYRRVRAWQEVQEGKEEILAGDIRRAVAELDALRQAWEGSLDIYFDSACGREEKELQVLPTEAVALVERMAEGFGSMKGLLELLQMRVAGILQSAKARRQYVAATTYSLLVRCCHMQLQYIGTCTHASALCQGVQYTPENTYRCNLCA